MTPAWNQLLRQARDAAGLTREALAARAGVSRETVAAYELRRREPIRETLLLRGGAWHTEVRGAAALGCVALALSGVN